MISARFIRRAPSRRCVLSEHEQLHDARDHDRRQDESQSERGRRPHALTLPLAVTEVRPQGHRTRHGPSR